MCRVSVQLRELVNQRLAAAADEIFQLVEMTIMGYEEETTRQRTLLEQLLQPRVQLRRIESPSEPPHVKEERLEDPEFPQVKKEQLETPEPPYYIKEEQDIIITQTCCGLKTEELLSDSTWDTLSSSETQPVSEAAPLPFPQPEEELLTPAETEEDLLTTTRTLEEEALTTTQAEEEALTDTQAEEEPPTPTQIEEGPLVPTQTEKDPPTFICSFCSQVFKLKSLLVRHLKRKHSKERPFRCSVCGKDFIRKEHLKRHVLNIHERQLPADAVSASVQSQQKVRESRNYSCAFCSKKFNCNASVRRHMSVHTGEKPFSCSICSQRFTQNCSVKVHLRKVHNLVISDNDNAAARAPLEGSTAPAGDKRSTELNPGHKRSRCPKCGKFVQTKKLSRHLLTHSGEKPFKCSVCSQRFTQNSSLKVHLRRFHTLVTSKNKNSAARAPLEGSTAPAADKRSAELNPGNNCSRCPKCGKFVQTKKLSRHLLTHTGEKPFSCSVCSQRFTQKWTLNVHLRKFHTLATSENKNSAARAPLEGSTAPAGDKRSVELNLGNDYTKCLKCGKFVYTKRLSRHLLIHTGEKPFKCSVCGNGFVRKDSLQSHMIVHSQERPFVCSVCGVSKRRKVELRMHMAKHQRPPPGASGAPARAKTCNSKNTCPICGKVVASLRLHMMTHNGERPFSCAVCGKRFTQEKYLQRHKVVHAKSSTDSHERQDTKRSEPSLIYCRIDD